MNNDSESQKNEEENRSKSPKKSKTSFPKKFDSINIIKNRFDTRFHGTVIALSIVSFLMNVSTSIYTSTATNFVVTAVTSSPSFLVSLRTLAEGSSYFIKVLIGVFSDITKKRKLFLIIGYGSMLFIKPIFILVALGILPFTWNAVFYSIAQITDRLLNAVRDTPRDSIIADVTKVNKRSQAFGVRRFFAALGSQVGGLIALILGLILTYIFKENYHIKYSILYIIAALPAFYCIYILKNKVEEPTKTLDEEKENWFSLKILLEDRQNLWHYIILMLITFILSFGKFNEICIFQMARLLGYQESFVIICYMYFYGIVALSSYLLSLHKQKDSIIIMIYSIASLFFNNILLGYFGSYLLSLVCGLTCLGIYVGITESVISGTIATIFPKKNMRATLFGIMNVILGISTLSSGGVIVYLSNKKIPLYQIYRYGIIPPIIAFILFSIFYFFSYKRALSIRE